MATPAQINAQLDSANTLRKPRIVKSIKVDGTYDAHYVIGGVGSAGRDRWVRTTNAETAANQATEILTGLAS